MFDPPVGDQPEDRHDHVERDTHVDQDPAVILSQQCAGHPGEMEDQGDPPFRSLPSTRFRVESGPWARMMAAGTTTYASAAPSRVIP